MRNHKFAIGEYYHVYNRGVDKRNIFEDLRDLGRFIKSIREFNTLEPIGSLYELSFIKPDNTPKSKTLVKIVAYCVNKNHFHFLLTPLVDQGVEKFMQRIGGYTRYFNEKHKRTGALFQGKFKSKHVANNTYLLHLSAYINMNNRNPLGSRTTKLSKSSLEEYQKKERGFCEKEIITSQFKNSATYLKFCQESWEDTQARRKALEI